MSPWLLLLLALWHCDLRHERITEAAGEKTESSSKKDFVATSSGLDFALVSKGSQHQAHAWCTPFSRQGLAEEAQEDGDFVARSMEMRSMQKTKQAQCFLLWRLWSLVGAVLGQDLHAPHQLCYGWIDAQRQQPPTRVECRWLGPETKESKEEIDYKPEKTRERRSQRQRKSERQQYDTASEQVAYASARLVQCQGRSYLGSDATKTTSANQTSGIICRSARFDCNTAGILSGWIAARAANQGGQDQEDIAYMDLRRHIGQMTKVKKELDALREARRRHVDAWKHHVESLVKNTSAQLTQYKKVIQDFAACEDDLTQQFQAARTSILQITQQSKPADEDLQALNAVDAMMSGGTATEPINVEEEANVDALEAARLQQVQSSLSACVASLMPERERSPRRVREEQTAQPIKNQPDLT